METLQLLGVALGMAALAGINLYLTVFVTGLAIQQQWIHLAPQYEQLSVLAHPAIITIAGVLYFLEFFADKVPWVDSAWDTVHTLIRPIGGAMLAVHVLGTTEPVFEVIVALLGGGMSLAMHGAKAATRLAVNASPEPFSNIILSVAEDIGVLGGLALINFSPVMALIVAVVACAAIIYFAPGLVRAARIKLWLIWKKLNAPAQGQPEAQLSTALPPDYDILFSRFNLVGEKISWATPCITGRGGQLPKNRFGYLIATDEEPRKLYFVERKRLGTPVATLDLDGYKISHESRFLSEEITFYSPEKRAKFIFVFARTQAATAKKVGESVERRLAERTALLEQPVP